MCDKSEGNSFSIDSGLKMLSKKDHTILSILQKNARTPISEISRNVNLSENGVRYRLEKLEKEGYIKTYTVLLNTKKFGKNIFAIFNLEIEPKDIQKSTKKLIKIDQFIKIYQTTGRYSIKALGFFSNQEELSNFLDDLLIDNSSIKSYNIDIITKNIKDDIYQI